MFHPAVFLKKEQSLKVIISHYKFFLISFPRSAWERETVFKGYYKSL